MVKFTICHCLPARLVKALELAVRVVWAMSDSKRHNERPGTAVPSSFSNKGKGANLLWHD